ncbi:uncharacterized protein MELLADRAFT_68648 [Melampsora larici-populina 98AG31]|uniref:Uncharacterized protein n=1 Tax=Melampsora larici-populina (strain 98AG31 / pathotype 3-4-7) TaxID=747676 RepID=F4S7J8_MELLP|nr:uncharacterized protein MELLADRAFT_68648 [Melampsora larici-populina 98AG31]EGF99380.1 hypothetical protein MELLADRAFT_68648 [Melampsora larici-populina 98AG31]
MSEGLELTQPINQYPSFDVPKLPNFNFNFCDMLGDGPIDSDQAMDSGSKRPMAESSKEVENSKKKARTLEERLAQLSIPDGASDKKVDVELYEDVEEQGLLNARGLVKVISHLEQAMIDIQKLKSKVEDLEVESMDMQEDLSSAHHMIRAHERVIRRFVGANNVDFLQEYDYNSSDDHSDHEDHKAQPQTDSVSE